MKNKIANFVASISYDKRLLPYDIQGSIAHCSMLVKCRIIKQAESRKIISGLNKILNSYRKGALKLPVEYEDVHFAVEKLLIREIGDIGGKLHTARSRNDQVSLDMRLFLRDVINGIIKNIKTLREVLRKTASKNIDAIMPGFTHLQHAQPVLFSHHIMAYHSMLERDELRYQDCQKRVNQLPLGAAALAGTSFPIDRKYTAKLLGFSGITDNSIDTVSDRDFIVEFISVSSILMMHLSRFAEEVVLWSSPEFDFIRLNDAYCTGSSIMPQKRNPDIAELVRGKTGRIYGNLVNMLTIMKGLPLSYNRDMQEDKPPLFDTVDTVSSVLEVFTGMVGSMQPKKEKMIRACKDGFLTATDVADYLVRKGLPFRKAHGIVAELVIYCAKEKKDLQSLTITELKSYCSVISSDVFDVMDIKKSINSRTSEGGTSSSEVKKQINK